MGNHKTYKDVDFGRAGIDALCQVLSDYNKSVNKFSVSGRKIKDEEKRMLKMMSKSRGYSVQIIQ